MSLHHIFDEVWWSPRPHNISINSRCTLKLKVTEWFQMHWRKWCILGDTLNSVFHDLTAPRSADNRLPRPQPSNNNCFVIITGRLYKHCKSVKARSLLYTVIPIKMGPCQSRPPQWFWYIIPVVFVIIQRPHLQDNARYYSSRSNHDDKLLKNVADLYIDEGQWHTCTMTRTCTSVSLVSCTSQTTVKLEENIAPP